MQQSLHFLEITYIMFPWYSITLFKMTVSFFWLIGGNVPMAYLMLHVFNEAILSVKSVNANGLMFNNEIVHPFTQHLLIEKDAFVAQVQ